MPTPTVFAICTNHCKYETMTREQIITAIEQAIESGSVTDVDAGFITKIKETRGNAALQFWVGTQAEYNEIETYDYNKLYIITDDTSATDINASFLNINNQIQSLDDSKVDKETGKSLTTNDFTNAYKNKIDGIVANATRTVPYYQSELSPIDATMIILPDINGVMLDRISIYPLNISTYAAVFLDYIGEISLSGGVRRASYIGYYISGLGGTAQVGSISGELDIMTGETLGTLTFNSNTLAGSSYNIVGCQTWGVD